MMKIRKPNMMANIWSSGKIVCQGARSEEEAKKGARRFDFEQNFIFKPLL